ncbi:MAG: LptF/LptG family permease [Candidatus Omnitrophota bacterium]|nr:MAG: LptF/LptG family permease [Candidatus Omnitrophota bacterium]
MRILDKYILTRIFSGYIFILLVFAGLYFVIDVFSHLSDFLKAKVPLYILINYYLYMLPLVFLRVSPFSLLISTLYTFGELNRNNEVISMRSSGLSIVRIAFPLIFFSLFVSSLAFFVQERILITSQKKVEDIKMQYIKRRKAAPSEVRNLAFSSGNSIYFVRKFFPKQATLEDATIFKDDGQGNIIEKAICRNIVYELDRWKGKDVMVYELDREGMIEGTPLHWTEKVLDLEEKPSELVYRKSIFVEFASLKNLKREITRLKRIKALNVLSNLIIDYHHKLAEPLSHLFLIIGIFPLALEIKKRKVALSSLGVGFIVGFIYYCLDSFSIALGKAGLILPPFASWLTPLFFIIAGIIGLILIK